MPPPTYQLLVRVRPGFHQGTSSIFLIVSYTSQEHLAQPDTQPEPSHKSSTELVSLFRKLLEIQLGPLLGEESKLLCAKC